MEYVKAMGKVVVKYALTIGKEVEILKKVSPETMNA